MSNDRVMGPFAVAVNIDDARPQEINSSVMIESVGQETNNVDMVEIVSQGMNSNDVGPLAQGMNSIDINGRVPQEVISNMTGTMPEVLNNSNLIGTVGQGMDCDAMNIQEQDDVSGNFQTVINSCINVLTTERINDHPVAILRYLQPVIVTGRDLEVKDLTTALEGNTNFIDRENITQTAFEEIEEKTDLRPTLEVNFYTETALDLRGPRKEFFKAIHYEIQQKYFEPVRHIATEDYETVGKYMAIG